MWYAHSLSVLCKGKNQKFPINHYKVIQVIAYRNKSKALEDTTKIQYANSFQCCIVIYFSKQQ